MRDGGRISAAIGVLADIDDRHKPSRLALKTWGDASRFAGAKDRAFVSGLVLDVLRHRRSLAWRMRDNSWRAAVIAALRFEWDWPIERIAEACADEPHGPGPLSPEDLARLAKPVELSTATMAVRGDYPDWLEISFKRVFGEARAREGAALAERAPIDLRVNTLKATRDQVLNALGDMGAGPAGLLPTSLRVPAPQASERAAPVESHPAFANGWFEVQDAGSQIASACAGDIRGKQVLDYCAGGGGKTLALAAAMAGKGRIFAYDADARRMRDITPRALRAGITNLEIRTPLDKTPLQGLEEAMDLVFVDAPCSGSGTWRRHPDAKWRLSPQTLARRVDEQNSVLKQAAGYVKPGGRLVYVTCSVLAEENEDRIAAFTEDGAFSVQKAEVPGLSGLQTPEGYIRVSPLSVETDGFFAAVLVKSLTPPQTPAVPAGPVKAAKPARPKPTIRSTGRPTGRSKPAPPKRKPRT
ncbi:RsmB/NOP family class I SAM-dependent RNA methyltransferase [soil metagenome]